MAGKLQVNTSVIASAAKGTQTIKSRLESVEADAAALEGMIPVSVLRRTAVDFASKWEISRKKMIDEIGQLKDQLDTVAGAFDEVDDELASRISDQLSD